MQLLLSLALFMPLTSGGTLIDRIAVIVENKVVKDSDIEREIRVTSYLNGEKPDFSLPARKRAAGRLIDQTIIRREIEAGRYTEADQNEVDKLFSGTVAARKSPKSYGLREDQVKAALKWQLTVLHFIELRFKTGESQPSTGTDSAGDPFIAWLDDMRKNAATQYREVELR